VRIGIVSQSYYPRYGGVTEHVHHSALELRRRGHEVTIITGHFRGGDDTRPATEIRRVGRNVLVPFNRAFVDVTLGVGLRRQLRRLLREGAYDVLHIHNPNSPTLPVLASEEARCATVGTFHCTSGRTFLQDTFREWLGRAVTRLDARLAVSRTAQASALLYYPGEYRIIPNGVDIERFHPGLAPFERWREGDHINLLFVGRLDPRKGLQHLLAAMPEVVERSRGRARLLIVGDSALRPRFEGMVPSGLRRHIYFMGHVPSADLPRWYATGDIFVSPASSNESFGIVLLEAMAAGRPVVATDIPGYRSVIVPGENAEAFPPGDVGALARTLSHLIDDPARREALARRGRARAVEFAWPKVVDRIEEVYRDTVQRRSAVTSAA
jgi:phosphatidyl-myo-inositol alpha-mannosyltransferase